MTHTLRGHTVLGLKLRKTGNERKRGIDILIQTHRQLGRPDRETGAEKGVRRGEQGWEISTSEDGPDKNREGKHHGGPKSASETDTGRETEIYRGGEG